MRIANANALRVATCGRCRYFLILCQDLYRQALPTAYKVCQACGELIYERRRTGKWYVDVLNQNPVWRVIKRPSDAKKI